MSGKEIAMIQTVSKLAFQTRSLTPKEKRTTKTHLTTAARTVKAAYACYGVHCTLATLVEEALRQEWVHWKRALYRDLLPQEDLQARLQDHLVDLGLGVIRARGLRWRGWWWRRPVVSDYDAPHRLWVLRATFPYHVGNQFGDWLVYATCLCGYIDGQYFAWLLPRGITTVKAALDWLTPVAVKRAHARNHTVLHQGEVSFVPVRRGADNMRVLHDTPHCYDAGTRTVTHPQHGTLALPAGQAFRAIRPRQPRRLRPPTLPTPR
jgi:hypothetical protein